MSGSNPAILLFTGKEALRISNEALYAYSREEAEHHRELDLWAKSHYANMDCARAIETAIESGPPEADGNPARRLMKRFGYDRVNWVLATTLQQQAGHQDISQENREWAEEFFADDRKEEIKSYQVSADPSSLSAFVDQARQCWRDLGLYDGGHCEGDSQKMDYTGKVLVLDPTVLKDRYKTPVDQLFLCEGGFAASPEARGRKVLGRFLSDGERTHYNRADFLGVLREEHLPDWAREMLEQRQDHGGPSLTMSDT